MVKSLPESCEGVFQQAVHQGPVWFVYSIAYFKELTVSNRALANADSNRRFRQIDKTAQNRFRRYLQASWQNRGNRWGPTSSALFRRHFAISVRITYFRGIFRGKLKSILVALGADKLYTPKINFVLAELTVSNRLPILNQTGPKMVP